MALTPAARHCLAGQDRRPDCVRTLGRDEVSRLSFRQALAALYRAGVPLDFAARYPRPRPASHLLPPHPKDEHPLVDDAHFLRRGEYSAGPLLGRQLAGPGPRFEVRMSAAFTRYADFVRASKVRLEQQAGPVTARRDTLASTREGVSPWTRTWPAR